MNDALTQQNKEIGTLAEALDQARLHQAALAVAKQAVEATQVTGPVVAEALALAKTSEASDVEALRTKLLEFADEVESPYLDALDRDQLEGRDDLQVAFRKARAVTALSFALGMQQKSARISLYESLHAGVPIDAVKAALQQ